MTKISKKEIRHAVSDAMSQTLAKFSITSPSKKTQRIVDDVARKVSGRIKSEVKKQLAKADRSTKSRKEKTSKKLAVKGSKAVAA